MVMARRLIKMLQNIRMHRVEELTVATLLQVSRIFKSVGQLFSELGAIDVLVELTKNKLEATLLQNLWLRMLWSMVQHLIDNCQRWLDRY